MIVVIAILSTGYVIFEFLCSITNISDVLKISVQQCHVHVILPKVLYFKISVSFELNTKDIILIIVLK